MVDHDAADLLDKMNCPDGTCATAAADSFESSAQLSCSYRSQKYTCLALYLDIAGWCSLGSCAFAKIGRLCDM